MTLTLKRLMMAEDCTLGILSVNGVPMFTTLELPWRNNKPDVSCIPMGAYHIEWVDTHTAGNVNGRGIGILEVPNRQNIRIHVGNSTEDTQGCILVGMSYNTPLGTHSIKDSRFALSKLQSIFKDGEKGTLLITNF